MRRTRFTAKVLGLALGLARMFSAAAGPSAKACTGIRLVAEDGTVSYGRMVE